MKPDKFIPQEKWHTCLSTAAGSVQEEGSERPVPAASGAPGAAACFLSHEKRDWVKGLGTETCGVSYSQRDGRGKDWLWRLHTLIRCRADGELAAQFLSWPSTCGFRDAPVGFNKVPQRAGGNPGTDIPRSTEVWKGSVSWVRSPKPLQQNPRKPEIKQHGQ